MELDQIETFLAVATFGGFHRAAEALRVSQPAVSARIKALEDSLGVSLFVRSSRGLTLSEAGRILRPHAEQLLRTASLARQAVHQLQPESGPLQIAAALSISVYFLPDILKNFQQSHPNLAINIRSGHSKEVLEMVLQEEAEIGLARSLQHPEVETISLGDDPLLLVTHPKHGPKHSRHPRLEEVANWPLVFFDKGSSDWTLTHSLFRRAGLVPNVTMEVDTIETAKRMVERGLGLSFLPRMAVGQEIRRNKLSVVKILDAEPLGRSLDLIHPRHHPLRSEALAFLQIVREAMNAVSAFDGRSVMGIKKRGK
ncbi:MAG TPA: LysR family transcriptional regulator [Terriglobales bacterium]|nr:LysR family transcriptional regulator [Terriglobales bacterium]